MRYSYLLHCTYSSVGAAYVYLDVVFGLLDLYSTPMRLAAIAALGAMLLISPCAAPAQKLPATITDGQFWRFVNDLSEEGGRFAQQVMSNEDSFQSVIPALKANTRKNGVYIGVGAEQNFTYVAATEPDLAFVID